MLHFSRIATRDAHREEKEKKMVVRNFFLLICISFTTALAGLFSSDVKTRFISAPEIILEDVNRVAVMAFEGPNGDKAADIVISGFVDSAIRWAEFEWSEGHEPLFFTVVERSKLDVIIDEQVSGMSGILNSETAAKIGSVAGVDAIMIGKVSLDSNESSEDREETYYVEKKKYTRIVRYYIRSVSSDINCRLIDTETGEILATANGYSSKKIEDKNRSKLPSISDLCESATESASIGVYLKFFPSRNAYSITLAGGKACKAVNKLIKKSELLVAYAQLQTGLEKDPYNHKFLYSLGVVYELNGNYDLAKVEYEKATAISSGDKLYKAAVERSEHRINNGIEMTNHGYVLPVISFDKEDVSLALLES